ncbi:MAG: TraK domain-containing protein [Desulfobulbaceae bacterium]
MNKTILLMAASAVLLSGTTALAESVITAEVPATVELSNRDVNRIVCPGQMNDLIFSQEKGLTGHFAGNNAFIKFKIEDTGGERIYAEESSELFVVCSGAVFTLLVTPKDIPSVTLRLAAPQGESFKQNIAHYKNLPLEKQALQLIREAYTGTYPSSYRISEPATPVQLSPDLKCELLQTVDVEGVGLRLRKYQATAIAQGQVSLEETLFLTPAVSDAILAVAVEEHSLKHGETSRIFVVEKKETAQ